MKNEINKEKVSNFVDSMQTAQIQQSNLMMICTINQVEMMFFYDEKGKSFAVALPKGSFEKWRFELNEDAVLSAEILTD